MKSDRSMGRPLNFSSGPPQSDPKSVVSYYISHVCMLHMQICTRVESYWCVCLFCLFLSVCVCVCVCVCVEERERRREYGAMLTSLTIRKKCWQMLNPLSDPGYVCVCVRHRETVCVCVCVCLCKSKCTQ